MIPMTNQQIKKFLRKYHEDHPSDIEISFLLQGLDHGTNVGSMFRLADAVGAKELVLTGKTPTPPDNDIEITSKGQENRVAWKQFKNVDEGISYVKNQGFELIALELTKEATLYTEYKYTSKVCLVLGNETSGVYPQVLSKCDGVVYIPMFGKNFSLNVHVTAAIVAYRALMK